MVTGGTGTFGNAFVRHTLQHYDPKKLIVLSRDEFKQSEMRQRLDDDRLRFQLGDVRDIERLRLAFRTVDIVVHAAALKQVPAGEHDPEEFVKTNVHGSVNVTRAALECGVEKCLLLSSDKACQPINLYGATKLCAEKIFQAAHVYGGEHGPRFAVTRYGNVAGSRGSVVPLFRQLAGQDSALSLTHANMSRFWMRIDQAVALVDRALRDMEGGEVFVPRLPSFWVRDLAAAIKPDGELRFVGIRPGEKMAESLLGSDEARNAERVGDVFIVRPGPPTMDDAQPYNSGTNDWWLGVDELKAELEKV